MASPLLMAWDHVCGRCRRPCGLFVVLEGVATCGRCWRVQGSPFPLFAATVQQIHEAQLATRERMDRRGGADRHLVRSGRT